VSATLKAILLELQYEVKGTVNEQDLQARLQLLTLGYFAKAYELRPDCLQDQNPFAVEDWDLVDTRKVLKYEDD